MTNCIELDSETGEKENECLCMKGTNAETGEPEIKKTIFQIPKKYFQQYGENHGNRVKFFGEPKKIIFKKARYEFYRKNKYSSKVFRISSVFYKKNLRPFVFVLPTLMFPGWATVLWLLCEACMHIWSHKR